MTPDAVFPSRAGMVKGDTCRPLMGQSSWAPVDGSEFVGFAGCCQLLLGVARCC
jgi:hypothetical protein